MPYHLRPVALVTGGARRIGAEIVNRFHGAGFNVVLHYRHSADAARELANSLNQARANSVKLVSGELSSVTAIRELAEKARQAWGRLDTLINNASAFYPTPLNSASEEEWEDLMNSNLKAPFFLAQALADELKKNRGCIVNLVDIHADRPLKNHPIYCAAKAGNLMLVKSLARELAPEVRVNGIAPGAILWPEQEADVTAQENILTVQEKILTKVPLQKTGSPADIARTILFLVKDAPYITGQIIAVDGGRSIYS